MADQSPGPIPPLQDTKARRDQKVGVRKQPNMLEVQTIPMVRPPSLTPTLDLLPKGASADLPPKPWTELPQTATEPPQTTVAVAMPDQTAPTPTSEPAPALELTWAEYSEWRQSKCPPPELRFPLDPLADELDQAIHEAVGEWAELTELICTSLFQLLVVPQRRLELLDELGDAYFTTCWVLAALGAAMPARAVSDAFTPMQTLEHDRATMAALAGARDVLHSPPQATTQQRSAMNAWELAIKGLLLHGISEIGATANFWKRVRWHSSDTPIQLTIDAVHGALHTLERLCVITGTAPLAAVLGNIEKLNRRFPDGWVPGGGNRK
jgi:hypothetical protein